MTDLGSFVGPLPTQAQEPESFDHTLHGGWSFILDYPRPPKGLHANDRTHWSVKHGATADIRLEVMARTRNLHIPTVDGQESGREMTAKAAKAAKAALLTAGGYVEAPANAANPGLFDDALTTGGAQ